jgi:hypothetical protein
MSLPLHSHPSLCWGSNPGPLACYKALYLLCPKHLAIFLTGQIPGYFYILKEKRAKLVHLLLLIFFGVTGA